MQENKDKNKEHSNYLPLLIDLIPDPAILIDSSGTIVATNGMAEKFTGHAKEQLVGKSFAKLGFVDKKYKSLLKGSAKDRLKDSTIPAHEIEIRTKNGEHRYLEIRGNRIKNEEQLLDLVMIRDVTERTQRQKKVQQDLFEHQEKFYGIANSVKDAIIVV